METLLASPSLLACGGGFFIGTYPIFVKTPAVLAARVHPVAFQFYKSFWVAVTGAALVAMRWARGAQPAFAFTSWAVLSACAWVPAGICLISAVPRAGVGAGVLLFDGSTTLLSFVVFTLVFHEPLKVHTTEDGDVYYLAPVYLISALLGMVGLALVPRWVASKQAASAARSGDGRAEPLLGGAAARAPLPVVGYAFAIAAGALSAVQYGIVTVAKHQLPPPGSSGAAAAKQALDPLGSWTLTFGLTACVINAAGLGVLTVRNRALGEPLPELKVREVWGAASLAGGCYALSVLLTTLAVEYGGNAVVLAQRNAVSLLTSGAWGLVYYREVRGLAALAWVGAAVVTMASVVLLGLEKGA